MNSILFLIKFRVQKSKFKQIKCSSDLEIVVFPHKLMLLYLYGVQGKTKQSFINRVLTSKLSFPKLAFPMPFARKLYEYEFICFT